MSIQTVFRCAMLLCASFCTGGLPAEALVITSDVTNWEGLTLPDAGEEIVIKDGVTAKVTTRAALEAIKDCSRIRPETPTSRFEVQVPTGETWTNFCPMSAVNLAGAGNKDFAKGEIYKTGEGTLCLQTANHLKVGTGTLYDWWTGLTAAEGYLRLPKIESDGTQYVGYITVSNGATFCLIENTSTYARGIFGDGVITNETDSSAKSFTVMNERSVNRDDTFHGSLGGNVTFYKYKDGPFDFVGTNSAYKGNTTIYGATLGAVKIGEAGKPSSIGAGNVINFQTEADSTLRYLGEGETATKGLLLYPHATRRVFLDGGNGGLWWGGRINVALEGDTAMRSLVFTGSNTVNECVVDGPVLGNYWDGSKYYGGLYYEKEGPGIWRFSDHWDRKFSTGFGIREGVFAYDSLDERGRLSSLGLATNLTAGAGAPPYTQVDYAYVLGTTKAGVQPAVFAYTGTNGYVCTTRPIALTGKGGHLRNDTAHAIRFRGVSSLGDEGVKTLTLDGSSTRMNEVADVTDGAGTTGVTKDGTGTWCLSGDLTFKGPLDVRAGTLIVKKTLPGLYKYFRWTIQEKHVNTGGSNSEEINLSQIALFDAKGELQSRSLTLNDSYSELEPGQFGFQTVRTRIDMPSNTAKPEETMTHPNKMFQHSSGYGMWAKFKSPRSNAEVVQSRNLPDTWLSIVMRLSDSAKEVASFDYMNVWYAAACQRSVKTSSLEGSVDGLHWNMLTNGLEVVRYDASWTWGVGGYTGNPNPHTGGAPVAGSTDKTYSVLTGNPFVSVAPGATLVADGDITIKNLTLDGEKGMGTLDGFAFDESGTINIVGDKAKFLDKAPADIRGATVGRVSDWAVSVNGTLKPGWKVAASADGIKIYKSGMVLLLR